jgi:hypothetical protein
VKKLLNLKRAQERVLERKILCARKSVWEMMDLEGV